MKKNITRKELSFILLFCASVFCVQINSYSQSVLFSENFESGSITSIVNTGDLFLPFGSSPCGKGSYANAAMHNSASVDFNSVQNPSFFLAVNPQDTCGGFYTANLVTDTMDFSGMDSISFRCIYFKSNTLMWGQTFLSVIFDNGTTTDTIMSEFSITGSWEIVNLLLDPAMISPTVHMRIFMGGGEGVGLDNFVITGYAPAALETQSQTSVKIYPNPASDFITISSGESAIRKISITDLSGKLIFQQNNDLTETTNIPIKQFNNGVYILGLTDANGRLEYRRFIVKH